MESDAEDQRHGASNPAVWGVLPLSRLMETSHSVYTDSIPFSPEILQAAASKDWKSLPTNAALAAEHTRHIEEAGIGKHCILAGYSSGGVLAFEVAHQLQRDGLPVDTVLSGRSEPPVGRLRRYRQVLPL